jgi:hypothetical protein
MTQTLVVTAHRQVHRQISRALGAAGLSVSLAQPDQLPPLAGRYGLVVADAESLSAARLEALAAEARGARTKLVLVCGDGGAARRDWFVGQQLEHLVAKRALWRAGETNVDERELLVTCQKALRGDLFGIDKYIGAWGVLLHTTQVTGFGDKARALAELERFLKPLDLPHHFVPEVLTTADELLANALLHGPRTPDGGQKYHSPQQARQVPKAEQAQLTYGSDGSQLMISVADPFGALTPAQILRYVGKALEAAPVAVELKEDGAGLGLAMAFRGIHQLVFNVHEHHRTEVIAGWYLLAESVGAFRRVPKSLNVFWMDRAGPAASAPPPVPAEVGRPAAAPRARSASAVASVASVAKLAGRIDETFEYRPLLRATRLDLRRITAFTSRGVVAWLRFMEGLAGRRVEAVGVPEVLVRLANEVEGVVKRLEIRTLLVPYLCSGCGLEREIEQGPDQVFEGTPPPCPGCGGAVELGAEAAEYQAFLAAFAPRR